MSAGAPNGPPPAGGPAAAWPPTHATFAELVRVLRRGAALTQEALAERAGLSVRALQDLEAGRASPRPSTISLLADALCLPPPERTRLQRAARPHVDRDALPAPPAQPHNLPAAVSSFVGRERELEELVRLVARQRCVTLVGPGGSGKTRLAVEAARRALPSYPHGVWLVELAPLEDPALVAQAVAAALGVPERRGRPPLEALADSVRGKRLLLVLDSCEHLVGECARAAAALLAACPGIGVMATSREALGIDGETRWPVPGLALPDAVLTGALAAGSAPADAVERLTGLGAVRLFVDRAVAAQPAFGLTRENAPAVVQVCRRLDGIPLAIELAAARLRALSVDELNERLEDRFRLLTGGRRTAPPRQQSLRAAVDWSYGLLPPRERALFDRLGVFAGGFTLAAVEAVCADPPAVVPSPSGPVARSGPDPSGRSPSTRVQVSEHQVLDLLTELVDKSLVLVDGAGDGGTRYRLLETLREYARERLRASGELETASARHAAYLLRIVEEAEPALYGPEQTLWLNRFERDLDNLRAALRWFLERGPLDDGLRLSGALWQFWQLRGYRGEGRDWYEKLLARSDATRSPGAHTPGRAKALLGLGWMGFLLLDRGAADAAYRQALEAYRALGDTRGQAHALGGIGRTAIRFDRFDEGAAALEESRALFESLGTDAWGLAYTLTNLALVASQRDGDRREARRLAERGLALRRQVGDAAAVCTSLDFLGRLSMEDGDLDAARGLLEESMILARAVGYRMGVTIAAGGLSKIALRLGNWEEAHAWADEALARGREAGYGRVLFGLSAKGWAALAQTDLATAQQAFAEGLAAADSIGALGGSARLLDGLAAVAAARGDAARAARLHGCAAARRGADTAGGEASLRPGQGDGRPPWVAPAREALGEEAWRRERQRGAAMSLEEAMRYALEPAWD